MNRIRWKTVPHEALSRLTWLGGQTPPGPDMIRSAGAHIVRRSAGQDRRVTLQDQPPARRRSGGHRRGCQAVA